MGDCQTSILNVLNSDVSAHWSHGMIFSSASIKDDTVNASVEQFVLIFIAGLLSSVTPMKAELEWRAASVKLHRGQKYLQILLNLLMFLLGSEVLGLRERLTQSLLGHQGLQSQQGRHAAVQADETGAVGLEMNYTDGE